MSPFVRLFWKRNRGWPWPDDSWGLGPMFGDQGWCRGCGIPFHDQSGSMVLRRSGLKVEGAWVPNWRFDAVCVEARVAADVANRFRVTVRPVAWHGSSPGDASQLVIPTFGSRWFLPEELDRRLVARHGSSGASCSVCGRRRWLPLPMSDLPVPTVDLSEVQADAVASPEWFGDGCQSSRSLLFRRELAESLVASSPKDFKISEL
jgi:hypothetical protein